MTLGISRCRRSGHCPERGDTRSEQGDLGGFLAVGSPMELPAAQELQCEKVSVSTCLTSNSGPGRASPRGAGAHSWRERQRVPVGTSRARRALGGPRERLQSLSPELARRRRGAQLCPAQGGGEGAARRGGSGQGSAGRGASTGSAGGHPRGRQLSSKTPPPGTDLRSALLPRGGAAPPPLLPVSKPSSGRRPPVQVPGAAPSLLGLGMKPPRQRSVPCGTCSAKPPRRGMPVSGCLGRGGSVHVSESWAEPLFSGPLVVIPRLPGSWPAGEETTPKRHSPETESSILRGQPGSGRRC